MNLMIFDCPNLMNNYLSFLIKLLTNDPWIYFLFSESMKTMRSFHIRRKIFLHRVPIEMLRTAGKLGRDPEFPSRFRAVENSFRTPPFSGA